jgi:hypothetical protein
MAEENEKRQRELVSKLLEASRVIEKQSQRGNANHVVVSNEMFEKMEEMKEYIEILERMKNRNKGIDDIIS